MCMFSQKSGSKLVKQDTLKYVFYLKGFKYLKKKEGCFSVCNTIHK